MQHVATVKITRQHPVKNGVEEAQVTIYVNPYQLAQAIGWKAVGSKSRRSKLQGGAVLVECDWGPESRTG